MAFRRRYVLVAGVLVAILLCTPVFLSGVTADQQGGEDDPSGPVQLQNESTVTIAEELSSASGELEVIVALSAADNTHEADVETLKARADSSQVNLRRFANGTAGITIENRFWLTNAVLLTVDTGVVPLDSLAGVRGVERIEPNVQVQINTSVGRYPSETAAGTAPGTPSVTPAAELASGATDTTYGLAQINAPDVWSEYDTRGDGVRVAVLDTGVDTDHPDIDLCSTCWAEFNETGDEIPNSDPHDPAGHGTHVSGTVVGGDASGKHIGVAPDSELLHGKVIAGGTGTTSQIIAGMEWAVEQDADVLSMSLGSPGHNLNFQQAVASAKSNGITVVAASGNDGEGTSASPGNYYSTIGVGATDESESVAGFSSGELIDSDADFSNPPSDWPEEYVVPAVAAPGADVLSAYPGGQWASADGTSMAAPHVAGSVALIQSATDDHKSHDELMSALESTAWKPDDWDRPDDERDTRYGYGIVDVSGAISELTGETGSAELSVADASLGATTILEGDSVVTTATVENTGDASGTLTAELTIDGTVTATESVSVSPGGTETVSFERTFGDRGEYTITVSGTHADELTVEKPATFETRDAELGSETVQAGETTTVTASIENVGDRDGTHTAGLEIDGETVDTTTVTLQAGETGTVTFERTFDERGEYAIAVNGTTAGTLTVGAPASFEVVDATLTPDTVRTGENATVLATVENTGGVSGTFTAALEVGGISFTTTDVTVAAGETAEVTLAASFARAGEYAITVSGTEAGTLSVTDAGPRLDVTNVTLADGTVGTDEPVVVTADLTNVGEASGTFTPALAVDGEPVVEQEVTLAVGESVQRSFEAVVASPGTYTLTVAGQPAGTVTVEGGDWSAPYVAEDGTVNERGLNEAIRDYLGDDLTKTQLNQVIEAYLLGEPLDP